MNSDISKRTSDFSPPNMNCASVRATSVLPTPVGPRNRNDPIGRFGFFNPARERRIARASALIDLSCEMNLETVRYYERRGLLPTPPRNASGYRLFPKRH